MINRNKSGSPAETASRVGILILIATMTIISIIITTGNTNTTYTYTAAPPGASPLFLNAALAAGHRQASCEINKTNNCSTCNVRHSIDNHTIKQTTSLSLYTYIYIYIYVYIQAAFPLR